MGSHYVNLVDQWRAEKNELMPVIDKVLSTGKHVNSIAVDQFENLIEFIEHVSLVMENDNTANEDKVSLMTLDEAKGLEFDCVYLPGWE